MSTDKNDKIRAIADRVLEMDEELEAGGDAAIGDAALLKARKILHDWIDGVVGVVMSPALGRVTLIHADGRKSSIASSDLPFLLSSPL